MTESPRKVKRCDSHTPEEARARFMVAASRLGPGRAIQIAPWKSVGLALGVGLLLGYSRPLRRGLVKLGKLSLEGAYAVVSHLCSAPPAEAESSTVPTENGGHPGSKCRRG